jgi:glutamine amidotransferase
MVAIIDYGVGNLLAIKNIIRKVNGESIVTSDPSQIRQADKLILPGVGAFGYGINQLKERNLIDLLNDEVLVRKKNILGLCLGAQLMTQSSEEDNAIGLGWVKGKTVRFDSEKTPISPHMGWSDVHFSNDNMLGKEFDESRFYFAHSYHFEFEDRRYVTGTTTFGYQFPCCFQDQNVFGVQFHPEKSHRFGMLFFANFLNL